MNCSKEAIGFYTVSKRHAALTNDSRINKLSPRHFTFHKYDARLLAKPSFVQITFCPWVHVVTQKTREKLKRNLNTLLNFGYHE